MSSNNTAPLACSYYWDGWVNAPGRGQAWAVGTVTVPADQGRAGALEASSRGWTPKAARSTPTPSP